MTLTSRGPTETLDTKTWRKQPTLFLASAFHRISSSHAAFDRDWGHIFEPLTSSAWRFAESVKSLTHPFFINRHNLLSNQIINENLFHRMTKTNVVRSSTDRSISTERETSKKLQLISFIRLFAYSNCFFTVFSRRQPWTIWWIYLNLNIYHRSIQRQRNQWEVRPLRISSCRSQRRLKASIKMNNDKNNRNDEEEPKIVLFFFFHCIYLVVINAQQLRHFSE